MAPVTAPPLGGHALLVLLVQASLLLGAALLLGRIAMRYQLPAVSGELTAGDPARAHGDRPASSPDSSTGSRRQMPPRSICSTRSARSG